MLREQSGVPPLSHTYILYDYIYDGTNKTKQKGGSHDASQKVCASWLGPMPGSDKSASGTSSPCHHSRTVTASRVAGTGQHLTRVDSENIPGPPD